MRVLFTDDDPSIRVLARIALQRVGGFAVEVCGSGAEALEKASSFLPDIVILDVMMPGMDGPETLRALSEDPRTSGIPVVFLTANAEPAEIARLRGLGAHDVLSKPFEPMKLPETIKKILGKDSGPAKDEAYEKLKRLRQRYSEGLPGKAMEMENVWRGFTNGKRGAEALAEMHLLAHMLSGSGESFGFPGVSRTARRLEGCLKGVMAGGPLREERKSEIEALVREFGASCRARDKEGEAEDFRIEGRPSHEEKALRAVFIVGEDSGTARDISLQLGYYGYEVRVFEEAGPLGRALKEGPPAALITGLSSMEEGSAFIGEIGLAGGMGVPLIFTSPVDDFGTRLKAVRAGGEAFFPNPVDVNGLVDKLDMLTSHLSPEPCRILIVDDELEIAELNAAILEEAAMKTFVLTEPEKIMRPLVDFRPELVLMDVYMPGTSGLELAKVIRQKEIFVDIPIVFLSSERDIEKQMMAMNLGGDDFLTKPIKAGHLISSVTARVRRHRILRSFMIRDGLTGLLNHTKTKEELEIELGRAERNAGNLAFVLIDLDHFKAVNDNHGHFAGDQVLKSLARLLRQRLRRTDAVGRYGGEEFGLVLCDMDGSTALRIVDEIRRDFALIGHGQKGAEFNVTFSSGIASYPGFRTPASLCEAADTALYEAKRAGRNRAVLAGDG